MKRSGKDDFVHQVKFDELLVQVSSRDTEVKREVGTVKEKFSMYEAEVERMKKDAEQADCAIMGLQRQMHTVERKAKEKARMSKENFST